MDFISFIIVALVSALQCLGAMSGNILEGKPSKQSSTDPECLVHCFNDYNLCDSLYANDDNIATPSMTDYQSNPFWEGDLGGFYNVTKITVTSVDGPWAEYLRGAVIETSTISMSTCPGSTDSFRCGQWPNEYLPGVSIAFHCSSSAVRYVTIRREVTDHLIIAEVAAEGIPSILPGQQPFDKIQSKKVTTPVKSLSVTRVTECGIMCHTNQPCVAFSFSKSQQPNCLLAIDPSMTTNAEWIGYKVNECMTMPADWLATCPPIA